MKEHGYLHVAYSLLGRSRDISPEEQTISETKLWFHSAEEKLKQMICMEFAYCANKKKYSFDRRIELIAALSGLLQGLVGQITAATILVLILVRQGLDRFCGCDTADEFLRQAHNEPKGSPRAILLLERAIEENPLCSTAYYELGLTYHASGNHAQSEANYRRAIEINRDDWYALNNLSCLLLEKEERPQEALALAKSAFDLRPDEIAIVGTYGWALLRNGRLDEAVHYLERAVNEAPSDERRALLKQAKRAQQRE